MKTPLVKAILATEEESVDARECKSLGPENDSPGDRDKAEGSEGEGSAQTGPRFHRRHCKALLHY